MQFKRVIYFGFAFRSFQFFCFYANSSRLPSVQRMSSQRHRAGINFTKFYFHGHSHSQTAIVRLNLSTVNPSGSHKTNVHMIFGMFIKNKNG